MGWTDAGKARVLKEREKSNAKVEQKDGGTQVLP
jgi:hypothetical protein